MYKNRKKNSSIRKYLLFFILFAISISIIPGLRFYQNYKKQQSINELVRKGSYPEMQGKMPTFMVDIKTSDSTTHVLSYLPRSVLDRKNFDEKAANSVISYVEQFAKKRNTFTYNPFDQGGFEVSVKMIPSWSKAAEHYVFFISGGEPVPDSLKKSQDKYTVLSDFLASGKTFFWTIPLNKGSVSFLRFSESQTFAHGLPTIDNTGISPIQQLNDGFNVEIWKRAVYIVPEFKTEFPDRDKTIYLTEESLWNTFGQLAAAKQEKIDTFLMERRLNNARLSKVLNIHYYPYASVAVDFSLHAPGSPIIH